MLLKLFKGTGLAVTLLIFVTAAGLWIGPVLHPELPLYYTGVNTMPLFKILMDFIGNSAIAGVLFSFGLIILMAVLLVIFNTTGFFITERTFLPAAIYVMLSALFPDCQTLNPALIASVFLLIALMRIMDAYRKNGTAYNFFDAALFISIGSLFYVNLIWMGLLVFLGIALLRTTNLKEVVITIIGLVTPYLLLYGIYYVIGKELKLLNSLLISNLFGESGTFYLSRFIVVTLIVTGLNVLISLFHLFSVFNGKKIKSRKTFSLLIWIFILAAVSYIVLPSVSDEIIYIIAIPVSYLISHYCIFMKRKVIPEIFFTAILALIIMVQIMYYR
jgi:hypothetical protein